MEIFQDDCVRTPCPTGIPIGSDVAIYSYPVVFAVITLPLSAVRWSSGFGRKRHRLPTATFAVEFIYSLSGALNVLLFLFTRSNLLLPRNRLGVAPGDVEPDVQIGHELGPVLPPAAHDMDPDPTCNGLEDARGNDHPDVQIVHEPRPAASGGDDGTGPHLT